MPMLGAVVSDLRDGHGRGADSGVTCGWVRAICSCGIVCMPGNVVPDGAVGAAGLIAVDLVANAGGACGVANGAGAWFVIAE